MARIPNKKEEIWEEKFHREIPDTSYSVENDLPFRKTNTKENTQ